VAVALWAAAILVASTPPLAALRLDPLGLVAAPPGIQIVIQDSRGLRGEGFPAVYGQVQTLLDDPEDSLPLHWAAAGTLAWAGRRLRRAHPGGGAGGERGPRACSRGG
jgi:hypothetical protein